MTTGFRLLTANLLNGEADPCSLGEVLDRTAPDVVLAQELGPNSAVEIARRYHHSDLRPALDYHGRGIASRFPVGFGTIPMPWREGGWASITIDATTVTVAGVHLLNPIGFPAWRSVRRRRDQMDALERWARSEHPERLVVAGDLNASPAWPAYRRLTELWSDLVAAHAESVGRESEPTWAWRPGRPRMLRIDHVLGSEGIVCTGVTVEPVRGSDHAAVVVDLELVA